MEEAQQSQDHIQPEVLILRPPPSFSILGELAFASTKFRLLKAFESALPLHQFLTTRAQSVRAILASGYDSVTADLLQFLPAVRLIATTSAGLNGVDVPECRRRGIAVANAGNVFSADVADLAVGLLIDVWRKISASNRIFRRGVWPTEGDYPLGVKLRDKHVGIVGLGKIGLEVAKRLEAFGCYISYTSRKTKPHVPYPFYQNASELAANCDALIICCGLTDQTRHMIDKEVMSALGRKGVVVNIGRGEIINEKELVRCLVSGEIGGAGLDVFENEPNVPKELFGLDNVVLSPHCAVRTPESMKEISDLVVGNFEAFFSGESLLSEYLYD